jgi:TolB-like protein
MESSTEDYMNASALSHGEQIAMRRCQSRGALYWVVGLIASSAILGACGTVDVGSTSAFEERGTYRDARQADTAWAVLPIANNTETISAGQRAGAILTSLLSSLGFLKVEQYPSASDDSLFAPTNADDFVKAKKWAKENGVKYALTGAVNEWRYKVGIDGEPAVGITLQVIDLDSDEIIWSGMASQTGWSRGATSALAQRLTKGLLVPVVGSATLRPKP